MLVEQTGPRSYLLNALESSPEVFEYLLQNITDEEADFRPDANRFTLREMMAHLADWEPIFLERLTRTRDENAPFLPDVDEGRLVVERNYAQANVNEKLRLFQEGRVLICELARNLTPEQWQRPCLHERAGDLTLEGLTTLVVLHDSYHLRQVAQWRRAFQER